MQSSDYIKDRDTLIANYLQQTKIIDNDFLNGQYTMVSAGLCNYLPSIDVFTHESIFMKLLLHKKLSSLEQASPEALRSVTVEDLTEETQRILKNGPTIICTFHTGSYRLINLLLIENRIPFTLVIGNGIIEEEGDAFKTQFNDFTENEGLTIINAEMPHAGLQMLREIKKGKSLLLYIDGNTGTGETAAKNDNLCTINFLHQQIYARKGIAFLAHAANIPILPVACYRKEWGDIRMKFHLPILPDLEKERGLFAEETTQRIFDFISPIIQTYPEQWESWLYLHKVAKIIDQVEDINYPPMVATQCKNVYFNLARFGVFKIENKPFLFNKSTYTSYPIEENVFNILRKNILHPISTTDIETSLLNQLYEKKVVLCL